MYPALTNLVYFSLLCLFSLVHRYKLFELPPPHPHPMPNGWFFPHGEMNNKEASVGVVIKERKTVGSYCTRS
jgi:hypothetical protein